MTKLNPLVEPLEGARLTGQAYPHTLNYMWDLAFEIADPSFAPEDVRER